jgi:hypothetical protein
MSTTEKPPVFIPPDTRRLEDWHDKAHEMHSAYAAAATSNEVWSRGLGTFVAVVTAFAGTTLFATLEGSTSDGLRLAAAILGSLGAIVSAVQTTLAPGARASKYHSVSVRYGALRRQMEEWSLEHPADAAPSPSITASWLREWKKAELEAPRLRERQIRRARKRIAEQKQQLGEPWFPTRPRVTA